MDAPKTKEMVKVLANIKAGKKALIVMAEKDENVSHVLRPTSRELKTRAGIHNERLRDQSTTPASL